jgi:hypothetical protein
MLILSCFEGVSGRLRQYLGIYSDGMGVDLAIMSSVRTLCSLKSDTR